MTSKPAKRFYLVRFANVRHNDIRDARIRATSALEAMAKINRANVDNRAISAE